VLLAKNLLFTFLVPGTAAVLVPWWIRARAGDTPGGPLLGAAALLLALAGLAIYAWCVTDFARAAGTPAPIDPPKQLVARGLYRYSRNPMYVGVLAFIAAQAVWFRSPWTALYALLLFGLFHGFVVLYEEPTLSRSFGEGYRRYLASVPRWLGRPRAG